MFLEEQQEADKEAVENVLQTVAEAFGSDCSRNNSFSTLFANTVPFYLNSFSLRLQSLNLKISISISLNLTNEPRSGSMSLLKLLMWHSLGPLGSSST